MTLYYHDYIHSKQLDIVPINFSFDYFDVMIRNVAKIPFRESPIVESPIADIRGLKLSSKVRDTLADFLMFAQVLESPRIILPQTFAD